MNIRAICFDADGVVVNPQKQFARHLQEAHGITPAMTRPFFNGIFNPCLEGKAELADVLPPFLAEWGWRGTTGEFIQTWLHKDHVIDQRLLERIQQYRREGITCCLATSQERNRAEYMQTAMGFRAAFDHLFFSCEAGWQKPHPAFFQHIQDRLGLDKQAILFWDDSPTNVAAAGEFGWNGAVYTDFDAFERTMKRYLNER